MGEGPGKDKKMEDLVEADIFIEIRFFQDIYDRPDSIKDASGGYKGQDCRVVP